MATPRDDCQKDLLMPALEAIIDLGYPLVWEIDWGFLNRQAAAAAAASDQEIYGRGSPRW
jgi:IS5 family transposase